MNINYKRKFLCIIMFLILSVIFTSNIKNIYAEEPVNTEEAIETQEAVIENNENMETSLPTESVPTENNEPEENSISTLKPTENNNENKTTQKPVESQNENKATQKPVENDNKNEITNKPNENGSTQTQAPSNKDDNISTDKNNEAENNTPKPEIPKNSILSIGDFKLYGLYEDGTKVEENVAINVKLLNSDNITADVINSIRTQGENQDIFAMFQLELTQNGRPMNQHTPIDIFIDYSGIFLDYENISFYIVSENSEAIKLEMSNNEDYLMFKADKLGKYVACGEKKVYNNSTNIPITTPLQDRGETGIIPTASPEKNNGGDEESVITPGAFVFWLIAALVVGLWAGIGIGYMFWGRYRNKKAYKGPLVIGE